MRTRTRAYLTTLALGLTLGGCLPCVPGVRVDAPHTAACLAATDGRCSDAEKATPTAPHAGGGDYARLR